MPSCAAATRSRDAWTRELRSASGPLPAAHRCDVTRIGGIETGWGWVARGMATAHPRAPGPQRAARAIRLFAFLDRGRPDSPASQRRRRARVAGAHSTSRGRICAALSVAAAGRRSAPSCSSTTADVVLVKRRYEPLAGQWSLPGGMPRSSARRSRPASRARCSKKPGWRSTSGPVVEVFDRILLDDDGTRPLSLRARRLPVPRCVGGDARRGGDVSDASADPAASRVQSVGRPGRASPCRDEARAAVDRLVTSAPQWRWSEASVRPTP